MLLEFTLITGMNIPRFYYLVQQFASNIVVHWQHLAGKVCHSDQVLDFAGERVLFLAEVDVILIVATVRLPWCSRNI